MGKTNWFEKAIVYQIYPFSYKDSNNDGWGDIPGIISRLDYIKQLGVTAIWFSPLYDSPDKDFGYDIRNYRDIDPKFGDLSMFQALLMECHRRDIKVIMDMVLNHTSNEHPWFQEALKDKSSPYRDYYYFREGKRDGEKLLPPTNWASSFTGSAWERVGDSDDFYLHLFTKEQPDLNWENPKVRNEIADILNYWLSMGVDGFRFDVFNLFSKAFPFQDDKRLFVSQKGTQYFVDGPRMHEFLQELYQKSLGLYDSFTVGESYLPDEEQAHNYVKRENHELDTIFHFEHLASDNYFNLKFFPKHFDLVQFKKGLFDPQLRYHEDAWNTLVLENHDVTRCNSRFGIRTKKYRYEASTMLPMITFLGFGIPFIYMGQEIGMTAMKFHSIDECQDPVSHFVYDLMRKYHIPKWLAMHFINSGARDQARLPMQWDDSVNAGFNDGTQPWQCMNPNYKDINVIADLKSEHSIFRFYQEVIKIKKGNDAAIYGNVKEFDREHKHVVSFAREYQENGLFVVGNFSPKEVSYPLPEEMKDKNIFPVLWNYKEFIFRDEKLVLRPYEGIVFTYKLQGE